MRKIAYPRHRVEKVLTKTKLPPSHRIIHRRYLESPLETAPGDSRFCARTDEFTVLYASPGFATAFIETVIRDRFTRKRQRQIFLKEITERAWVLITTRQGVRLHLLDLRRDGSVRLGAPTDAAGARNHAAGRKLGRAIHAEHEDVDGLLFSSRLTGADVYAVFNRSTRKLDTMASGELPGHPELPDVLSKHGVKLIASQAGRR